MNQKLLCWASFPPRKFSEAAPPGNWDAGTCFCSLPLPAANRLPLALPSPPPAPASQLAAVIRKIFSQIGQIREPGGLWLPVDGETKLTKGYAFVDFLTPQEAQVRGLRGEACEGRGDL